MLIEAAKIVNENNNNWVLRILGKGPKEKKLKRLIKKYNLQDKVKLIGFKSNPFKYMAASDVFILSSLFEGFGHVIVESLASGTPVLATDCPSGPAEILKNGEYGWLVQNNNEVEMANKIIELLNNKSQIIQMSKNSLDRANDFKAQSIVNEYEKYFFEI